MVSTLTGVPASPGTVVAPAVSWEPGVVVDVEPAVDIDDASARVVADLQFRATTATTPEGTAVLEALAMFAADPELLAVARARVDAGEEPEAAVRAAAASYADQLRGLGGYLAERAADVEDVGVRLADALAGRAPAELPHPGHPYVLVARDLAPADTALLDPAVVVGIITEQGGPTSHTTILARSLGIPAVVACAGARAAVGGHSVLLDGTQGQVHVDPPASVVDEVRTREERAAERRSQAQGPGATADGVAVKLLANVGTLEEARAAAATDVEGIGLFRTEFLFLGRTDEPTPEEQVETYASVLAAFEGRRVVFRTLDAGSDKPVPFLGLSDEDNPALGIRGLRTAVARPDVLERQLAALAEAAARTGAEPWVMAPMVSTPAEADAFGARAREAGLQHVGVMVEVPSAALRAGQVLRSVDFASIGTNDLAQYALAADRQLGDVAELLDPWQPALLDLVAMTCSGASAHELPVGVCGEAAADPQLAIVLVGLGVRSLSMAPRAVAAVRSALAEVSLADCERAAVAARAAADAASARAVVAELLG
ncbi:phosphoenolpyruvate--protein phosphotransferase [Marmoricola sp. URHA0025 HA25]